MHRWIKTGLLALAACLTPQIAQAQVVFSSPPGHVVLPATSYYAPPVTVYSQPVTVYSPPITVYSPPPVAYYSPPVTSYYAAPVATYYAAPVAAVTPGVVTTRTYTGLGIFRPRGVYTESYVAPVAPRTSYYVPLYMR